MTNGEESDWKQNNVHSIHHKGLRKATIQLSVNN